MKIFLICAEYPLNIYLRNFSLIVQIHEARWLYILLSFIVNILLMYILYSIVLLLHYTVILYYALVLFE